MSAWSSAIFSIRTAPTLSWPMVRRDAPGSPSSFTVRWLLLPDELLSADVDVVAPCALGGILNERSIASLKAKVVCGGANNQLAEPEDGRRLTARGILYAPDYLVNAGGIINVVAEYMGETTVAVDQRVRQIPERLGAVFDAAEASAEAPNFVADSMARSIVANARSVTQVAA